RLHPEQIAWIVNHAEDQVLCFDMSFLPIVQAVHAKCPTVKQWVALCDANKLPADSGIPGLVSYEAWIGAASSDYQWPNFDENTASSMCYTSGTTGNPKAVLYSHRSTTLHAYAAALPDVMCLSARDAVLPVVPMFHVNAWGIPYSAALTGCKLVFPGPALDGKSVYELMEAEGVTFAAGVPTVWQMLLNHVKAAGLKFSSLKRTVIGGSACPPAMITAFQDEYGVSVLHAWGMTEMSPLGTLCTLKNKHLALGKDEQMHILQKQGRAVYGVEMKIVGDDGQEQPWDGKAYGDLLVRGPWIVDSYFKGASPLVKDEHGVGWFPTGDVATIDADGYMHITDRSKDVIKSGGEWISSIDIENIAMAHPAVAMAACIGMPHPKWDERPIVVVAKRPGAEVTREELLAFYERKTAKWQIPDDVVFVDAIPLGATGKMLKTRLREQLAGYKLPGL
ncbi:MAG: long-chain-fatty-acid--CoA ligase, partial [Proteobacteria bacterium]|nr:long-chain-fatty-acid--CoA ligase [Pseudomonadota bacterium]